MTQDRFLAFLAFENEDEPDRSLIGPLLQITAIENLTIDHFLGAKNILYFLWIAEDARENFGKLMHVVVRDRLSE